MKRLAKKRQPRPALLVHNSAPEGEKKEREHPDTLICLVVLEGKGGETGR